MYWLDSIVEEVFHGLPYCQESKKAREDFQAILSRLADDMAKEGKTPTQIAGELLRSYGDAKNAGLLLGVDLTALASDPCLTREAVTSKNRAFTGVTLLFPATLCLFIYLLLTALLVPQGSTIIISLLLLVLSIFFFSRIKALFASTGEDIKLSYTAVPLVEEARTIYRKRLVNSLLIALVLIAVYTVSIAANLVINSADTRTLTHIFAANTFVPLFGVFLALKNGLRWIWYEKLLNSKPDKKYQLYVWRLLALSAVYWVVVVIICLALGKNLVAVWNTLRGTTALYALAFLLGNFIYRQRLPWGGVRINKWRIATCASALLVMGLFVTMSRGSWFIQPYISTTPYVPHRQHTINYDEEKGVYSIYTDNEDFKILQLTDIHLGGSAFSAGKDHKALEAVFSLVSATEPDLVVVTGDLVFPMGIMSFSLNNYIPVLQYASFMRNMGIPWIFAYGNHDTESMASHTPEDLDRLLRSLSYKNTQNLLYPQVQPPITGRNNQLIKLVDNQGGLIQALFILDSNAYTGDRLNSYDYIHDDQVLWYEAMVTQLKEEYQSEIPSLMFFHIPLQEYQTAYALYKNNSDSVIYHYGKIGEADEAICCSDYPSGLFDKIVALGSTKAIFVGHDHYNNISLEYQGVRLTYGMSIDYLAMPGIASKTEQRGATLITLETQTGRFVITPVRLTGIQQ